MGDRAERKLVRLEREMEWRRRRRAEALYRSLSPHHRSDARGRRRKPDLGLARQLVRRARAKMERVRKLFSRRELLRLGRAQCLWTDHAVDPRWHRKFCIQNARSLSTLNEACARKA